MFKTHKHYVATVISAAALVAGAAHSSADEAAKPLFYGNLNVSFDEIDSEGAKNGSVVRDVNELNSNNSRIGVTHGIPLEQGLTGILKAEYRVNTDDGYEGANGATQKSIDPREVWAGVKGDFGQVIAGRINSPLRASEGRVDQFNHLYADIQTLLGGQGYVNNAVQYSSPKIGDVVINIAQASSEDETLDDLYAASVVYIGKTIYAAAAYETNGAPVLSLDGVTAGNADRIQLVGSVKLGATTLGGFIQQQSDSSDSDKKDTSYIINAAQVLNKVTLKAQAGVSEGNTSNDKRELLALGADYSLGKNAYVFANHTTVDLNKNAGSDLSDKVFQIGYNLSF